MDNSSNGIPQITYNSRSASPWQAFVSLDIALSVGMTFRGWWPAIGHFLHTAGPKILNITVAEKETSPLWLRHQSAFRDTMPQECSLVSTKHCIIEHRTCMQPLPCVSHIIPFPSFMHSSCISPLFLLIMGYGNDDSETSRMTYWMLWPQIYKMHNVKCLYKRIIYWFILFLYRGFI